MGINFIKKLSLFFVFRSKLLDIENDIKLSYNLRIDNIYRFYTVLNIPENIIEEPYNFRKSDIDTISKKYIEEYMSSLMQFLNSKGLTELYRLYDLEKVDKYSYLLIFGYSLFNTKRIANRLIYIWVPILFMLTLISTILILIKNT